MNRVPYEIVAEKINWIIIKMATSIDQSDYYWEQYIIYIEACGWSDLDFDKETLRRIDLNWENY